MHPLEEEGHHHQPQVEERRGSDDLLLESIQRVGVQNYSLLSRLTGLNPETIRYKVNKRLARVGLSMTININYGELGLSMSYLMARPGSSVGPDWMDKLNYQIFGGKLIGSSKYFGLFAVPFKFVKNYSSRLAELKESGAVEGLEHGEIYWVRYPPFKGNLYDFEKKAWKPGWKRAPQAGGESGATFFSVNTDSNVDFFDIKILRSMLDDPTTPLSRAAKTINANPRTLAYHNVAHVSCGHFILSGGIRCAQREGADRLLQVALLFRHLDSSRIAGVRRYCNNLPFTWFEAGTRDGTYLSLSDVPVDIFQEVMRTVEANLAMIGDGYELLLLGPVSPKTLQIPDNMFDQREGWLAGERG